MSYFDDDLQYFFSQNSIQHYKLDRKLHDYYTKSLNQAIPFNGSTPDWSKFKKHLTMSVGDINIAINNLSSLISDLNNSTAIVLGDSLLDEAYLVDTIELGLYLGALAEIPQNSYVFPENLDWIICITSYGDIHFGQALNLN
ncbi:hypothetical protein KDX30_15730 [Pseudomonas sp. CDFA 553]|uniref:hypothetical protein n=1 Tax=Pseudomonas quasicaspiana TaxID=2829821 RepID=UPI001E59FA73|nr:hypothetical protein [Pseudomonas quasicaspiana]MCD5989342.1 hypothetical protein [Pseudomonas quasicaspiana]